MKSRAHPLRGFSYIRFFLYPVYYISIHLSLYLWYNERNDFIVHGKWKE